jgi:proteasome lid subunit RPN8/RPN11
MSGDETDVRQIDVAGLAERRFPGGRNLRVWIDPQAHETAWRQATESVKEARKDGRQPVEVGGVLLGNVWRDEDGPFLEIVAAIPAEHTRNEGTQMTFTPETWAQVNGIRDESYPQTKMVGWYHTHPSFGIFLSEMDHSIHRRGFSQPWATALVLDPIRETEGFFLWTDGEPRLASEYWVGAERRDRSWVGQTAVYEPAGTDAVPREAEKAVSRASFALVSALNILALVLLFGYLYAGEARHTETERFVLANLQAQKADLQAGLGTLQALSGELENSRSETRSKQAEIDRTLGRFRVGIAQTARSIALLQESLSAQQGVLDALPRMGLETTRPAEVKKK